MPKKPAAPKPFVQPALCDPDEIGTNLHTALRKCCDSDATTKLYLLIAINSSDGVWADYCNHIYAKLTLEREIWVKMNPATKWEAYKTLAEISRSYRLDLRRDRKRYEKLSSSWLTLFDILLKDLDDSDWEGFASFLTDDYGNE